MCRGIRERDHDARRAVAPLDARTWILRVRAGGPVRRTAFLERRPAKRLDGPVEQLALVITALHRGGAQQRVRVSRDAVGGAEELPGLVAAALRPHAGAELAVECPGAPEPANRVAGEHSGGEAISSVVGQAHR